MAGRLAPVFTGPRSPPLDYGGSPLALGSPGVIGTRSRVYWVLGAAAGREAGAAVRAAGRPAPGPGRLGPGRPAGRAARRGPGRPGRRDHRVFHRRGRP